MKKHLDELELKLVRQSETLNTTNSLYSEQGKINDRILGIIRVINSLSLRIDDKMVRKHSNSLQNMSLNMSGMKDNQNRIDQELKRISHTIDPFNEIVDSKMDHICQKIIPIGFVYSQLPFQKGPKCLWPWAGWQEVTSKYRGHFFRAEGGGSAAFGISQRDEIRQHHHSIVSRNFSRPSRFWRKFFSAKVQDKNGEIVYSVAKFHSNTETRPKNFAIKIWRRIS